MVLSHRQVRQGNKLEAVIEHVVNCRNVSDDEFLWQGDTTHPYFARAASFLESH
jgi:hypothetical protein